MSLQEVRRFFHQSMGHAAEAITALPASGSARENFVAASQGRRYVVTRNTNLRENEAFFYFSEIFSRLGLNTPKIFHIDKTRTLYIQQFLGEQTLSEIITAEGESVRVKLLVQEVLHRLFHLQEVTQGKIDYSQTFEYQHYDRTPVLHDLNYFKFMLADILEIPYHKSTLLGEFEKFSRKISQIEPRGLMIRDFQARNILVDEKDQVHFIDYQSAMEGPMLYDVVSLLYQAKANFSGGFIREMLSFYIEFHPGFRRDLLWDSLPYLVLIRQLQVLGAYGFRGIVQQKEHFRKSLPLGIKNALKSYNALPEHHFYPELGVVLQALNDKINNQ